MTRFQAPSEAAPLNADLSTIKQRYYASLLPTRTAEIKEVVEIAAQHLQAEKLDGTWPDLNYANKDPMYWSPSDHIQRLHRISKAYRLGGSQSAAFREGAVRALAWWLANDPQSSNWWWNQIGTPEYMGEILLLLERDITPDQKAAGLKIMMRSKPGAAGANLVWLCENQIVRGVLSNEPALVEDAYRRVYGEIHVVTKGEGIQTDWSFHQHGAQFYSGSYGLSFVNDCIRYTAFAWGTRYQIPSEAMRTLTNFILDGQQWMIRGDTFDHSAIGREVARPGKLAVQRSWINGPVSPYGAAYGLLNGIVRLAALPVPRRDEYQKMAKRLQAGNRPQPPDEIIGNRHYWCSDYMAHRREAYFASVRMFSTRLQNTEVVNGEGLQSHHLADGTTFFYRTGTEYQDLFPLWEWHRVPGTTAEQDEPLPAKTVARHGETDFVGGVSDGVDGMATMDFRRGPLSLQKAWFCFDDEIVCLGASLACSSDRRVVTTVNQCWGKGNIEKGDSWFRHDGIGYLFPKTLPASPSPIAVVEKRTGSWAGIGAGTREPITGTVFQITLDHGVRPSGAAYAYTVIPGASAADLNKRRQKDPVQIISNTADVQAVRHQVQGILQAAFYSAGTATANAPGWTLTVDQPCAVCLTETRDGVRLAVSNPRNLPLSLIVTLDRRLAGDGCTPGDNGTTRIAFTLPDGPQAGQSRVRTLRRVGQ
jgi:chondroitin AC lyase